MKKPHVENAPGLTWKPRKQAWEARWHARTDLIGKGFLPKSQRLWIGVEPSLVEAAMISDACNRLQNEMLIWGRGGTPQFAALDGTLGGLIKAYQTDKDSSYHKKRYQSRQRQDNTLQRIMKRHGDEVLADINARLVLAWHKEWSDNHTKVAMGHAFIANLRILCTFGKTIFEDAECRRLKDILHEMRFPSPKAREERMTAEQAIALRKAAHAHGHPSIALAQAFQFDLMLRQKDVIGEWVPIGEPGPLSDIVRGNMKWVRGLRWDEIDDKLVLRHMTSKKSKPLVVDLKMAPMVMEELNYMAHTSPGKKSGAIVRSEVHGLPWYASEFRRKWRLLAEAAGLPKSIRNQDSRAGGISEATDAGADLEMVRHAATHSNISMTQRYSRGAEEKIAAVMQLRTEHRNKQKPK